MQKSKVFTNINVIPSEVRWDALPSLLRSSGGHFSIEHNFENLWSKAANQLSLGVEETF